MFILVLLLRFLKLSLLRVRVNKFVQLADDLARVMEASSVRIIAPIPGKSSVGVEIPNRNPATVFFKSVVNSPDFIEATSLLTLAIGKTTSGEISTLDLAKMPHLLIAGTTGSGKSGMHKYNNLLNPLHSYT